MKALILAAGRGERLRPLTDTLPKPLVPIAGRPLIEYHIERLAAAGIRELVINVFYLGQQIMDALGDGKKYGVRIQYSVEQEVLEVAGGIINALPLLNTHPFLLVNSDVWTDYPFEHLIQRAAHFNKTAHLVMVNNSPKHPDGDFHLVGEKLYTDSMPHPTSNKLTYSGIALFTADFFAGVASGCKRLRPLLDAAILADTISAEYYAGEWNDIGTINCWQQLNYSPPNNKRGEP